VLEPPDLPAELIAAGLRGGWGLAAAAVTFLPLGADPDSAVYRVEAGGGYFLKLRRGEVAAAALAVPRFLADRGVGHLIPALPTRPGQLSVPLAGYAATLYPFIEGRNAFQRPLSEPQWSRFGATLRAVHTAELPAELAALLPRESYPPTGRDAVTGYLAAGPAGPGAGDPIVARLVELLDARAGRIRHLVERAGLLAAVLRERDLPLVLCHSDIHAGNLLVTADDEIYLVDWDTPVLAPKERDLMFVGAGIGGVWHTAREQQLFYRGYGDVPVDPVAVAYYRYERIIADIAAFCAEIRSTDRARADREQSLAYLSGQFEPAAEIDIACRAGDALLAGAPAAPTATHPGPA